MNGTAKLFNYFYYYNLGNPRALRNEYVKACDNGVCGQGALVLLQALTGDYGGAEGCDLLQAIHDGLADRAFYQGHRDALANVAGFTLNLAALGLSAHSGAMTITTGNADQWR